MPQVRIVPAEPGNKTLQSLIALHLEAMQAHSPPESVHALDVTALMVPGVELFTSMEDGRVLAMGAIRALGDQTFEIKSMRTRPDCVGRGLGRSMLEHLIAQAVSRGARRLSLETGSGPAFEPALALYRSRGFQVGPAFGDYEATAFNQFLHLDLPFKTEIVL